ncbi:RNA polymerase sigma factor SigF [Pseudanabaena sp. PCC 6802]|uniref:RNA polymerase sigma factor SigF n=1 Tax=Pseudanabaena sp. PCC 6802 TaxID=118173 RepID=UPI000379A910|nr:sigma-70 family RNA polymerase sigma factor [Pseudanabaena sp. PCC 6802]
MSSDIPKQVEARTLDLVRAFQDNPSTRIRDRLVQVHIALLQQIVQDTVRTRGGDREEIMMAGVDGFAIAIQEFDLSSREDFGAFATPYIQEKIHDYFNRSVIGIDKSASTGGVEAAPPGSGSTPAHHAEPLHYEYDSSDRDDENNLASQTAEQKDKKYQSFRLAAEDTKRLQNLAIGLDRLNKNSSTDESEQFSIKSETFDLLQEYRKRPSVQLRNRLVQLNMGLARKEAYHWTSQCTETFDDLLQVGLMGLIRAIERFDTVRGHAFSSFAVPYIRGEIQHYLRDKSPTVRTPRRWLVMYNNGCKVLRQLREAKGREPTDREIAEHLEIPLTEWQEIKLACQNRAPVSLDTPISDDSDQGSSLGDLMADSKYQSFQLAQEDSMRLYQALSHLEERTRQVVEFVFIKEFTHREVAEMLGISAVTVSRQVKKGITTLKQIMVTPLD